MTDPDGRSEISDGMGMTPFAIKNFCSLRDSLSRASVVTDSFALKEPLQPNLVLAHTGCDLRFKHSSASSPKGSSAAYANIWERTISSNA